MPRESETIAQFWREHRELKDIQREIYSRFQEVERLLESAPDSLPFKDDLTRDLV